MTMKRVAVIGAGTIGASWTAYFLSRGLEVVASDPSPGAPDLIRRMVENAWPILARLGATPDADPTRWRFEADPARAVEGAEFVQESAPERLEVKHAVLAAIDAVLPEQVVIASSTSGLLASRISEKCRFPGRVVIAQRVNSRRTWCHRAGRRQRFGATRFDSHFPEFFLLYCRPTVFFRRP